MPGIRLHLATEVTSLWQASEAFLQQNDMAPPFWAFAWPGAEALAAHIGRYPELVRGRRVLDFAAGSGLAAIACAQAGADGVTAAEVDPLACAAISLNAAANGVRLEILAGDIVGRDCRWDVVLCGDIFYDAAMVRHVLPWLRTCAAGALVLAADPSRAHPPRGGIKKIARMVVPTSRALEDRDDRDVALFEILPAGA